MARQASRARRNVSALCLTVFAVFVSGSLALGRVQDKSLDLPARVLIIRHAEKPVADDKSVHLNAEGQERAEELYKLFKVSATRPDPFPTPDFIFAAKNSKHSHRSVETVTPLAKKLKMTINSNYADEDFAKLAQEILQNRKYAGKTLLVCWHHGMAADLAHRLKATDAPMHWKGTVFDRVWQITYDKNGMVTFLDRPQQLLSKDSEK
jgi:phosphohistidine phosphatase SixA